MLLPRYMNLSINFRGLPFRVEMAPQLKHMYSILFAFTYAPLFLVIPRSPFLGKGGCSLLSMKMFKEVKTQGLQRMILFIVELFASVKCFSFFNIKTSLTLNLFEEMCYIFKKITTLDTNSITQF